MKTLGKYQRAASGKCSASAERRWISSYNPEKASGELRRGTSENGALFPGVTRARASPFPSRARVDARILRLVHHDAKETRPSCCLAEHGCHPREVAELDAKRACRLLTCCWSWRSPWPLPSRPRSVRGRGRGAAGRPGTEAERALPGCRRWRRLAGGAVVLHQQPQHGGRQLVLPDAVATPNTDQSKLPLLLSLIVRLSIHVYRIN